MARSARPVLSSLGPVALDRDGAEPLHRQLYRALRQAVLDGRLRPGERLPPSRALATEWGLSRNTVVTAYDTLLAEGTIRIGWVDDKTLRPGRIPAAILQALNQE